MTIRCGRCGRFYTPLDRLKAEASDHYVEPSKRKHHTPMSHDRGDR